jgi:hypothetical protein
MVLVQEDISGLTDLVKNVSISQQVAFDDTHNLLELSEVTPINNVSKDSSLIAAGQVLRDSTMLVERFHGPWTLAADCKDLSTQLTSHAGFNDSIGGLLNRTMKHAVDIDDEQDLQLFDDKPKDQHAPCLPPKQFLTAMLDTFFKLADYQTNIFLSQHVDQAVDVVYQEPSNPSHLVWILCLNLMTLLALGVDQPLNREDQFVKPILQTVHTIAAKPSLFMSQRLITVQALALLSLLAEQYHSEILADHTFIQACTLAKTMGLNHTEGTTSPSEFSPVEVEERRMVFRSLYMRDRSSTTTWGVLLWLPSPHHMDGSEGYASRTITLDAGFGLNRTQSARWELTEIQDALHNALVQANNTSKSLHQRSIAIARVQQRLIAWSKRHEALGSDPPATTEDISLSLAFLGTYIRTFQSCSNSNTNLPRPASEQALHAARLSCLLIATSCSLNPDTALTDRLERLLDAASSSEFRHSVSAASSASSSPPSSPVQHAQELNLFFNTAYSNRKKMSSLRLHPLHRLINAFPCTSLFALTRSIIETTYTASQMTEQHDLQSPLQEATQDTQLLEALLACFRNAAATARQDPGNRIHRVVAVTSDLIEITHALNTHLTASKTRSLSVQEDEDAIDVFVDLQHAMPSTMPLLLSNTTSRPRDMPSAHTNGVMNASSLLNQHSDSDSAVSLQHSSSSSWIAQDLHLEIPSSMAPAFSTSWEIPIDMSQFFSDLKADEVWGNDNHQQRTVYPDPEEESDKRNVVVPQGQPQSACEQEPTRKKRRRKTARYENSRQNDR